MSELFHEIYSAYYHKMAQVLRAIVEKKGQPLKEAELNEILSKDMSGKNSAKVRTAIDKERWHLRRFKDGTTPIKNAPTRPMTLLEKQWLKAVYLDPRIRLFIDESDDMLDRLSDVEPLFSAEDVMTFDRHSDGDPYTDETYIKNFKLALDALEKGYPVVIRFTSRDGHEKHNTIQPEYLEYSEKDDKFRLVGYWKNNTETFNMAKITSIEPYIEAKQPNQNEKAPSEESQSGQSHIKQRIVTLELVDEKNVLERVLLHFAHFKKETEKLDNKHYRVKIWYDKEDESEMVIRVMSFGPSVTVTGPKAFVEQIKKKLIQQMQMWE